MPRLTVIEQDGKLVIVSQVQAQGGPADSFVAVKQDGTLLVTDDKTAATEFAVDGGKMYFLTHHLDKHGDWLPEVYHTERF